MGGRRATRLWAAQTTPSVFSIARYCQRFYPIIFVLRFSTMELRNQIPSNIRFRGNTSDALSSSKELSLKLGNGNGVLMLARQSFNQQLESSYAEGRAKQRRSRNHRRGCSLLPQLFVVKPGIY